MKPTAIRLLHASLPLTIAVLIAAAPRADQASQEDYVALPGPSGLLPTLPDAVVDLRTRAGVDRVGARWSFREATITQVPFHGPGSDLGPTGPPNRAYDITPRPGAPGFDPSQWRHIGADSLEARRTAGRVSFGWYHVNVTLPDRVGDFEVNGATVVFEIVVDDYAEIWIDGKLSSVLGQRGGSVVAGFNAPNRVIIARGARPDQHIGIEVFAMNGPISTSPENFVWVRSATLDFYDPRRSRVARRVRSEVVRVETCIGRRVGTPAPTSMSIISPARTAPRSIRTGD